MGRSAGRGRRSLSREVIQAAARQGRLRCRGGDGRERQQRSREHCRQRLSCFVSTPLPSIASLVGCQAEWKYRNERRRVVRCCGSSPAALSRRAALPLPLLLLAPPSPPPRPSLSSPSLSDSSLPPSFRRRLAPALLSPSEVTARALQLRPLPCPAAVLHTPRMAADLLALCLAFVVGFLPLYLLAYLHSLH